jgi:diadenosine tetraphosphate (Ap4A) HIT family hydrolase
MEIDPAGCYSCAENARMAVLPPRERVAVDEHWRVVHAMETAVPGWLILIPRRHVTAVAELTDSEAAGLGIWQVRLSRALQAVTECTKTYVVQFAEAPGFGHVHFHLVPRAAQLPADLRGPAVFRLLGVPAAEQVGPAERDRLALSVAAVLAEPDLP